MAFNAEQEIRASALREAMQIYRSVAGDEAKAEAEIERIIEEMNAEAELAPN